MPSRISRRANNAPVVGVLALSASARPRVAARLALLSALVVGGVAVAGLGVSFTGNPFWWLAVPVAVAIGWVFVADPTACVAPEHPVAPPSAAAGQAGLPSPTPPTSTDP